MFCGGHGAASVYGDIAGSQSGSSTAGPGGAGGPTFGEAYQAASRLVGGYGSSAVNATADYFMGGGSLSRVAATIYESQSRSFGFGTDVAGAAFYQSGGVNFYLANQGGGGASGSWGIPFAEAKDHWSRHGEALGTRSVSQYHMQAERNVAQGRDFRFRIDGEQRLAHITRFGADAFMFTSTNLSETRIFTHMRVNERYLSNIGITLPREF
jgi:hypothetical protein